MLMFGWWKRLNEKLSVDVRPDGFGQSAADDLRFFARFRQCRRQRIVWRKPTQDEEHLYDHHPVIGRFGNFTVAVAEEECRLWLVRERMWHGFPDPEEFVFFVLEGKMIWAAADFDYWPQRWTRPDTIEALPVAG